MIDKETIQKIIKAGIKLHFGVGEKAVSFRYPKLLDVKSEFKGVDFKEITKAEWDEGLETYFK